MKFSGENIQSFIIQAAYIKKLIVKDDRNHE